MAKIHVNTKRLLIDKTNSRIVAVTAVAAFFVVFALVTSKTLISQAAYQNRIISGDKKALNQLNADLQTTTALSTAYQAFVAPPQNVLGGSSTGNGLQDGNNAKVVLDALPSQYDFPAMAATLEKLLTSQNVNVQIQSITGIDEAATQPSNQSSPNPQPIAMPFQISVAGNYLAIQNLIMAFGRSIRPFQIQTLQLAGGENNMTLTLSAETFYQPAKQLNISEQVIR